MFGFGDYSYSFSYAGFGFDGRRLQPTTCAEVEPYLAEECESAVEDHGACAEDYEKLIECNINSAAEMALGTACDLTCAEALAPPASTSTESSKKSSDSDIAGSQMFVVGFAAGAVLMLVVGLGVAVCSKRASTLKPQLDTEMTHTGIGAEHQENPMKARSSSSN